ncbi:MAG: hypothetical protein AAF471_01860 [Myxococcota bacterium]
MSFLRKQESIEKVLKNKFDGFLEGPFRRDDRKKGSEQGRE